VGQRDQLGAFARISHKIPLLINPRQSRADFDHFSSNVDQA
jgi:hypothetical protein